MSIQAALVEKETINGKKKYAVCFTIPIIYDYRGFFGHRIVDESSITKYMTADKDGFPVLSWNSFWTEEKSVADKLLQCSRMVKVEPEIRRYDPNVGRP